MADTTPDAAMPPKICGTVSRYAMDKQLNTERGRICGKDTYGVGDHGGEDRALGIVAIVFAGDEGDSHDLEEEDGRVQERL